MSKKSQEKVLITFVRGVEKTGQEYAELVGDATLGDFLEAQAMIADIIADKLTEMGKKYIGE